MITPRIFAEALVELTKKGDVDTVLDAGISFCRDRNMMYLLPGVLSYLEMQSAREKEYRVTVIKTAHGVDESVVKDIESFVDGESARHMVEPLLIGGFTAETGERFYDASIKRHLYRLKKQLQNY